ncbi:hypothetical protein MMEU_4555 [Mycobacterium marinum str. Europe]|nr:hypothetical protein MMEU_4555 [Mycobacterium marinum str. Europe]
MRHAMILGFACPSQRGGRPRIRGSARRRCDRCWAGSR